MLAYERSEFGVRSLEFGVRRGRVTGRVALPRDRRCTSENLSFAH